MFRMKKIIWTFLTFSALAILVAWFHDDIRERFFVYSIIINLATITALLSMFGYGVYYAIKVCRKERKIIFNSLIPLLIVIALISGLMFIPWGDCKVNFEHVLYKNQREKVIEDIRNSRVHFDERGNTQLPSSKQHLSTDGNMVIFKSDQEGIIVGFWVFRGMLSSSTFVLYSSQDSEPTASGLNVGAVEILQKLDPNWFYVRIE